MSARLCVGVVVGARGLKGELRIRSFTAQPADVAAYGPVEDESGTRRLRLTVTGQGTGRGRGVVTARAEGVGDRTAAEALAGVRLYVVREAMPATDADEYYHADLLGLRAERADGTEVGRVTGVFDFGGGDLLEIAGKEGTLLLPFTRAAVPLVDMESGRLVVEPPVEVTMPDANGGKDGGDGA